MKNDSANPTGQAGPLAWLRSLPWKRLLFWGGGLALLIGIPYLIYLDGKVRDTFAKLQWQEPTRVFARPLQLAPGQPMDSTTLVHELVAAGYRFDPGLNAPGNYAQDGTRFKVATRAYFDIDGYVPERRLEISLGGGEVRWVRDLSTRKMLQKARIDPARIATLYGSDEEERKRVKLEEVPALMVAGLQAVEDRKFKHHIGVDFLGLIRAAFVNVKEGELEQGASTLTQQLVRNDMLLGREKTLTRKFNEILYALLIELRYDKRTILEAYFNQVYMGQVGNQEIRGISAGAEFWFARPLKSLTVEEQAALVAIVKGPSYFDPRRHPQRTRERRDLVLGVWQEFGLIDAAQAKTAKARPLSPSARPTLSRNRYPAFMDLVKRQLASDYSTEELQGAGLTVITTLAPSAQLSAERAVASGLSSIERKKTVPLQAGLVVTDTRSGDVVAMVGNRRADEPGFNRALEAQRPVGSLLKPFVYLLAYAQPDDYSLAKWVDDSPIEVTLPNGKSWKPKNSDGRSHGWISMNDALARSYNQATVRLGMEIGPERLSALMKALGKLEAKSNPSLILGAVDLSPFQMAQLYQFLASGGQIQPLRAVRGVLDPKGKALSRYDQKAPPAQDGDAIASRLVTLSLQHTVTGGTARQLLSDGLGSLQSAGKTGTSNDGRDSWYAGYTGSHLAVAWVGNDQNETTGLYGATGAMRVWSALFKQLPSRPLRVSGQGLEWAWLDASEFATTDENCPGARRVPFVAGYLPQEHKACEQMPEESWLDWFRFGRDEQDAPEAQDMPPPPPPPET